ncbi:MAG: pyridoxamine kinase [Clostridiales bacterium]|nr:pyridoxamine kinase [Clostridiales bacterium]
MIKKAAVINDLSGFGKCSLTASIAILSVMGVQPCPMPTAVLTNQTGYKKFFSLDFTDYLHNYSEMWRENGENFDGIYSGYVADKRQIDIISDFIAQFKKSYTRVLVDPVMGDNGSLYSAYTAETCDKIKNLVKKADLITPNLTELCLLTDTGYEELVSKSDSDRYLDMISEIARKAVSHSNQTVIVTGIKKGGCIYNEVVSSSGVHCTKSLQYGSGFSGTGDIFASIICASVINGDDISLAAERATGFIETAIQDTVKEPYNKNDGINFEKFLYTLH